MVFSDVELTDFDEVHFIDIFLLESVFLMSWKVFARPNVTNILSSFFL